MSKRRFTKILEKHKSQMGSNAPASITIYSNETEHDSFSISAEYRDKKLTIIKCDCGQTVLEYFGDLDIESFILFDEINTQKMIVRLGAHHPQEMLNAIYNRFCKYKYLAFAKILFFCNDRNIAYTTSIY